MFLIKSVLGLKKYPYTMISQKTNIIHQHKKSKFLFFIFLLTIYFVCLLMHAQISNVRTFYIKMGISNLIYVDTSFVDEQIVNATNIKWNSNRSIADLRNFVITFCGRICISRDKLKFIGTQFVCSHSQ